VAHELFTELDEICVKDGKDAEWKETARSGFPPGAFATMLGNKAPASPAALQLYCYEEKRVQAVVKFKLSGSFFGPFASKSKV